MLNLFTTVILTLISTFLVKAYANYRRQKAKLNYWPGNVNLFAAYSLIGIILPKIKGLHRDKNHAFDAKHDDFKRIGWNLITNTSIFPPKSFFHIADAQTIKEITLSRAKFPKPLEAYGLLKMFGSNVVVTEGDEWKRHRRISVPAFSNKNNRLVWDSTVAIVEELMDDIWQNKAVVAIDHFLDISVRIALMVLSVAGYGRPMHWKEDGTIPLGHQIGFAESLVEVSEGLAFKFFLPSWAMGLTQKTRRVRLAFEELEKYMSEMIIERRTLLQKEEKWDLLSNLIRGSDDDESGEAGLSNEELTGNIFIYLIAGHETTAHTLCYAFGLLALYAEEQEKLYDHIQEVLGDRKPTYEDYSSLSRVLAVVYETLRLYPLVAIVPKRTAQDTFLNITSANPDSNETANVFIPKGSTVSIHVPAVHYNPRYWKDPEVYNPDRFLGDWNKDAFLVFSNGARACMGKRFSETESVAAITTIIRRYKVSIKEEPHFQHETLYQKRERIFKSVVNLTLTPIKVPLVFTRRK